MASLCAQPSTTLENLLSAYTGETNAHAHYNAFAQQASQEGLPGASSLFRAAARAEQILATKHARVIARMGATPECPIYEPRMRDTLGNLKNALSGEQYDVEMRLPCYLVNAMEQSNREALISFECALDAEKSHVWLFRKVLPMLESCACESWLAAPKEFAVCAACGYTCERQADHRVCLMCQLSGEMFELIR